MAKGKLHVPNFQNQMPTTDELYAEMVKLRRSSVNDLPLEIIKIKSNVRTEYPPESIEELANSIKEHGQIQPIVVHPEGATYTIYVGHRRYFACKKLGLPTIKAIIMEGEEIPNIAVLQLIENIQREDLSPKDLEITVTNLVKSSKNKDVALLLNKSESWVSWALSATHIRERLEREGVDTTDIGTRHLAELSSVPTSDLPSVVKKAKENGGTVKSFKQASGKKEKNEIIVKITFDPLNYSIKATGDSSDAEILGQIKKSLDVIISNNTDKENPGSIDEDSNETEEEEGGLPQESEIEDPLK
jgi:ParB/RepB/Spo0J family partition protein